MDTITKKVRRVIAYLDYLRGSIPDSWKAIESRGKSEIYHSLQHLATIRYAYEGLRPQTPLSLLTQLILVSEFVHFDVTWSAIGADLIELDGKLHKKCCFRPAEL